MQLYNNQLKLDLSVVFLSIELIEDFGSGGRDRTADLGVMNPPMEECANYVLATFTNIFRGSQPVGSAPVYV